MNGHEVDVLDEIRTQLRGVGPSAEFIPGVRRRIVARPGVEHARALTDWRWAVAVAAAILAAAAGAIWQWTPARHGDSGALASTAVASGAPVVSETPTEVAPPRPVATTGLAVVRRRPASRPSAPAPPLASDVDGDGLPPVITNQPAILRALWARSRTSQLVAETTAVEPVQTGEIVVAPILVPQIEVKWLTEPAEPRGPAPIIRKFAAAMAERSGR